MSLLLLQLKIRKRMVFVAIVTTWIVVPAYLITFGSLGTDIVDGTCIPWGVYSSDALQKAMVSLVVVFFYFAPLTAMLFCYTRIVYVLTHKVTRVVITDRNHKRKS